MRPTVPVSIGVRLALGFLIVAISFALPEGAFAREGNRTLKLFFGHTGERGEFTFKRNGRYDRAELARINQFLRDWRKNEPAKMDPQLLDLIWTIYKQTGSNEYIHIVSAYRSPATNESLRRRSSGVAKNSQHTQGKAMDFFIPGVPLDKLRVIAMKQQGGGVGYYPKSGSPFVHADTGSVRAWPRMSRTQLVALFPGGNTLHVPADGKPLPGYEQAVAKRKAGSTTQLAYLESEPEAEAGGAGSETAKRAGVGKWLKRVFDGGAEQAEDEAATELPIPTPPMPAAPADPEVLIAMEEAGDIRLPRARPGSEEELALAELRPATSPSADDMAIPTLAFAPLPRTRPDPTMLAESLENTEATNSLAVEPEDAIATLLAELEPVALAAEPQPEPSNPVQLAFAAADDAAPLSAADQAIIAAFASGPDASPASPPAAPTVAVIAPSGAPTNADSGPIGVIFAAADLVSSASAATSQNDTATVPTDSAMAMTAPVANPGDAGEAVTAMAMPVPEGAPGLYSPEATATAGAAQHMAGQPVLSGDRFASKTGTDAKGGFFAKLFASFVR